MSNVFVCEKARKKKRNIEERQSDRFPTRLTLVPSNDDETSMMRYTHPIRIINTPNAVFISLFVYVVECKQY